MSTDTPRPSDEAAATVAPADLEHLDAMQLDALREEPRRGHPMR